MKRRDFLKHTVKFAALSNLPFILPSGRLFAATGEQKAKHVVLCLFAGGIRNFESLEKREGNLMPHMLEGDEPINPEIAEGITPMPRLFDEPIQQSATLYKQFRYQSPITLHYNAHASALSGHYNNHAELLKPPEFPTVFEYFRKHSSYSVDALNTWWVSDQAGPFPFLNYSRSPSYGAKYAANMIQPSSLFRFNFDRGLDQGDMTQAQSLLNRIRQASGEHPTESDKFPMINSAVNQKRISDLIYELREKHFQQAPDFWNLKDEINDDLITMFTAVNILKTFHPQLLVVNMQDSDVGHSNFTGYCNNLQKADYALAKLWSTIQEDPELKDNTVLIAVPEFGRNEGSNTIMDSYGRYAVDHTGEEFSKRMFCMIAGPKHIVHQNKIIDETKGELIDIVPTIAHLLGFDTEMPLHRLNGKVLYDALV